MTPVSISTSTAKGVDSSLTKSLRESVRALYEHRPYPHYPLLAKPRWQEGWIANSLLSKSLAASRTGLVSRGEPHRILVAGCGEILPAVICANEPAAHRIDAVDLSRRSLRRAWFRCVTELTRLRLKRADLEVWCTVHQAHYDHIDCFGVLHHMADPLRALATLAASLKPGGTARIMIYNSPARSWIHEWQAAFRALHLNQERNSDIRVAMTLLSEAGKASPSLAKLLERMGPSLLTSTTRFADTFLHPREARLGPAAWIKTIEQTDLTILGLLDRYEECDDLPNPLWGIDHKELIERIDAGQFEGNLEFFVQKNGGIPAKPSSQQLKFPHWAFSLFSSPPRAWWQTTETSHISPSLRRYFWRMHREHIAHGQGKIPENVLNALHPRALQRLARMGALLPGQLSDEWNARIKKPLGIPEGVRTPFKYKSTDVPPTVTSLIEKQCAAVGLSSRRKEALMLRLRRAMYPK